MKLSFSTKGWNFKEFDEYIAAAVEYGFSGIELTNIKESGFASKGGPLDKYNCSATAHKLYEASIKLPCIDSACDISGEDKEKMTVRFWRPVMKKGRVRFCRPEECREKRHLHAMEMKKFPDKRFSGLNEFREEFDGLGS